MGPLMSVMTIEISVGPWRRAYSVGLSPFAFVVPIRIICGDKREGQFVAASAEKDAPSSETPACCMHGPGPPRGPLRRGGSASAACR